MSFWWANHNDKYRVEDSDGELIAIFEDSHQARVTCALYNDYLVAGKPLPTNPTDPDYGLSPDGDSRELNQ